MKKNLRRQTVILVLVLGLFIILSACGFDSDSRIEDVVRDQDYLEEEPESIAPKQMGLGLPSKKTEPPSPGGRKLEEGAFGVVETEGALDEPVITEPSANPETTLSETVLTTTSSSKTTTTKSKSTGTVQITTSSKKAAETESESGRTVYRVDTDKNYKYMGNSNTRKFHLTSCDSASRTKESNRVYFETRDEAIEAGYEPCKRCKP